MTEQEKYMKAALKLAHRAAEEGEVPVGAVVVCDGKIVGRGRNRRETKKNALHHAELVSGVMEEQCADELRTFFRELREKRKLIRKAQKSEKAAAESGESQQDAFCEREK